MQSVRVLDVHFVSKKARKGHYYLRQYYFLGIVKREKSRLVLSDARHSAKVSFWDGKVKFFAHLLLRLPSLPLHGHSERRRDHNLLSWGDFDQVQL